MPSAAAPSLRDGRGVQNASPSPAVKGYRTGGTILHFIVNNRDRLHHRPALSAVWTPHPSDGRSPWRPRFSTSQRDDPEAAVYAAKVATEYRQQRSGGTVIDMFCYRHFGHNEGNGSGR